MSENIRKGSVQKWRHIILNFFDPLLPLPRFLVLMLVYIRATQNLTLIAVTLFLDDPKETIIATHEIR